jgi:hypothetical protein
MIIFLSTDKCERTIALNKIARYFGTTINQIVKIGDTSLTEKKFKDFFQKNIATI